ncbi:FG-GAP-like repeat-containing protein [Luteimonas marina]|uniref:NHL domain-containing protein n=1 Tax=Luteimonas marina TaxID=488485 RepID=UPI0013157D28|nr:FG-GAP-like repeat-containing protein [Luteimonas marina]
MLALLLLGHACWQPALGQAVQPVITTIAGGGAPATGNGDGGPATSARVEEPVGVAVDAAGNVYVAERYGFTVRKVGTSGVITTVAGNGTQMFNGDGIPATSAAIDVRGIAVDAAGHLYIADGANGRVRKVSPAGIISTIARTGLTFPTRVAVSRTGTVFVVDGSRVFRIVAGGGIEAFAGTGQQGSSGDGGPALQAMLDAPSSIAVDRQGTVYIVEGQERVRRIGADGVIRTVAGGGHFRIDPKATNYDWLAPLAVAADSRGNFYVAGRSNVVRIVNADGIAADAAGTTIDGGGWVAGGNHGFAGDGGPAVDAWLYEPEAVALDGHDNLYIADTRNNRIRKVTAVPTPRTPAGIDAFSAYRAYGVGSYVVHAAIGDINGDGRNDVLLTTATWGGDYVDPEKDMRLWLFLQQPDGTLASPRGQVYAPTESGGRFGTGLGVADLNGDGFDDVVVGTLTGITVFLGNATGLSSGLAHRSNFPNAEPSLSVTIMDVDRDNRLDVVTLSSGRSEGGSSWQDRTGLIVHHGNGLGGFTRQSFIERPANVDWTFLRATDVNRDGLPDLTSGWSGIVDGYYRGGAEVTLHNGVAGFRPTTRITPALDVSWGPTYAFGDFDADGRKDAIVSHVANSPEAAYARFRHLPDGGFVEEAVWQAFDVPEEMLAADMNGDGRDDLLVIHSGWSSVGYHEQTTDSGLDVEIKYYIPHSSHPKTPSLAVGDLNGDGCKDVAIADRNHGLIVLAGRNCIVARRSNGSQPLAPGVLTRSGGLASASGPDGRSGSRAQRGSAGNVAVQESVHDDVTGSVEDAGSRRWPLRRSLLIFFGLFGVMATMAALKFRIYRL